MSIDLRDRFTLCQVSPDDWVLLDASFTDDAHRLVGCVTEHDGFVEVRWFRRVALPLRFPTRADALDALVAASLSTA